MALEDDLDALYACPPGEFVDRRKALAQALRKAGKREEAAAVAGAAKPSPAAWAVNQLAHRHPEELASLMSLGEALRIRLRAAFTGKGDAAATAEAQAAQREAVARLTRQASDVLEAAGVSSSPAVLERVAATLTAISTTGRWGEDSPRRLTRELDPPGFEALAALVADLASAPGPAEPLPKDAGSAHSAAPATAAHPPPPDAAAPQASAPAPRRGSTLEAGPAPARDAEPADERTRQEAARQEARRAAEEAARLAAEEARERVRRAEAALESAAAAEEQARIAADAARASLSVVATSRAEREAAAREARRVAEELQQAADEARRAAETAARAARESEDTATLAARAEASAKADLAAAEQALSRAASEHTAAEETLVRERRRQQGTPGAALQ
jgi:hypothetical protein